MELTVCSKQCQLHSLRAPDSVADPHPSTRKIWSISCSSDSSSKIWCCFLPDKQTNSLSTSQNKASVAVYLYFLINYNFRFQVFGFFSCRGKICKRSLMYLMYLRLYEHSCSRLSISLSSIQLLISLKFVAGQLSCSPPTSVTLAQNQAMSSKAIKETQTDTRII